MIGMGPVEKPGARRFRVTPAAGMRTRWLAAVCVTVAVFLVLHLTSRTPQLWFSGFRDAPGSHATEAVFRLTNPTRHTIYLGGPNLGLIFFTREVSAPGGWQPAETPAPPKMEASWGLIPGQSFVFSVPAMTNQPQGWRVTVRYFDGAVYRQIPVIYRLLPKGGPLFRVPWEGSGRYRYTSSDILTNQ